MPNETENKGKAVEARFNHLHNLLTEAHIKALDGEPTAADLKAAADWLHKNGISGCGMSDTPLGRLRLLVPEMDAEDIQRRAHGG